MSQNFENIKTQAVQEFSKWKQSYLKCPALPKEIKFTSKAFSHIIYKDDTHIRPQEQQEVRFLCFKSVKYILEKSHFFQEYMAEVVTVNVKKNGKEAKEKRLAQFYGFVAVVENNGKKHRIRVVVRNVEGFMYAEYWSVMPAWKMKGYKTFMGSLS